MQRRGFMAAILAAGAAPAFVKAGTLMPLWVPNREIQALTYAEFERMLLRSVAESLGLSYEAIAAQSLYVPATYKHQPMRNPFPSDAHWPGVKRLFTGHSK